MARIEFSDVYAAVKARWQRRQAQRRQREQARAAQRLVDEDLARVRAYERIATALVREGVYMPGATRWTVPIYQFPADPPRDDGGQNDETPWALVEYCKSMEETWRKQPRGEIRVAKPGSVFPEGVDELIEKAMGEGPKWD